jgi:hypothetical protein
MLVSRCVDVRGDRMIGILAAAAAVLVLAAGLAKLRRPDPAGAMLRRALAGRVRPDHDLRNAVRVAAGLEVAVAVLFLVVGGRVPAALLAATYLGFLAVVVLARRRPGATSCGCFGRADAPLGVAHLGLDAVGLLVAALAVGRPVGALGGLLDLAPAPAVIGGAQLLLVAGLGFLSITALPALAAARHPLEAR